MVSKGAVMACERVEGARSRGTRSPEALYRKGPRGSWIA